MVMGKQISHIFDVQDVFFSTAVIFQLELQLPITRLHFSAFLSNNDTSLGETYIVVPIHR